MEDTWDVSEWLGQKVRDLYPHRFKRGDIEETDGGYIAHRAKHPIDVLYDRRVIDDEQYRAGVYITILRRVAAHEIGAERMNTMFRGFDTTSAISKYGANFLMNRVLQRLQPHHRHMINRVCLERQHDDLHGDVPRKMTKQDLAWVAHCCNTMRASLDSLKKSIDEVLDSCENAQHDRATGAPKIQEPAI